MLKALTITALLAIPAAADTLSGDPTLEGCVIMADAAETAMTYRQRPGATIMEGLRLLEERADDSGASALAQAILMEAFKRPAYSSDRYKAEAIAEFANEVFALCMRDRGELM